MGEQYLVGKIFGYFLVLLSHFFVRWFLCKHSVYGSIHGKHINPKGVPSCFSQCRIVYPLMRICLTWWRVTVSTMGIVANTFNKKQTKGSVSVGPPAVTYMPQLRYNALYFTVETLLGILPYDSGPHNWLPYLAFSVVWLGRYTLTFTQQLKILSRSPLFGANWIDWAPSLAYISFYIVLGVLNANDIDLMRLTFKLSNPLGYYERYARKGIFKGKEIEESTTAQWQWLFYIPPVCQ